LFKINEIVQLFETDEYAINIPVIYNQTIVIDVNLLRVFDITLSQLNKTDGLFLTENAISRFL